MTNHKTLKHQAQKFFKQHKSVTCPAFPNEKIVFNSKGLSHIFYKGSHKTSTRPEKETATRITLLPHALKVLEQMPLIQEESSLTGSQGRVCKYFAFEAVVDNRRVKVIIRQVGNGNKHFWSVIPAWRKVRNQIVNAKSNLSKL